jgi:hypothetical protein
MTPNTTNKKIYFFFSNETKNVLFRSFLIAYKNKLATVDLDCLFYALITTKSTLSSQLFRNFCYETKTDKKRLLVLFKEVISHKTDNTLMPTIKQLPILSKSVRELLFKSICQINSQILTTDYLLINTLTDQKIQTIIQQNLNS